jgi:phage FluMu protein Com
MSQPEQPGQEGQVGRTGKEYPPEWQAILMRKRAPNGLLWRPIGCELCGYHLGDEAILLGCYRKKCPRCKYPNVIEVNRVGEEQLEDKLDTVFRALHGKGGDAQG